MAIRKVFRRRRRRVVRRKKTNNSFIGKEEQVEARENTFFAGRAKSGNGSNSYSFSQPGDPQEVEADAMAEKVMQIHNGKALGQLGAPTTSTPQASALGSVQLKCSDCKEEKKVHKMGDGEEVDRMENEEVSSMEGEVDKMEEEENKNIATKGEGQSAQMAPPGFTKGLQNSKGQGSPLKPQTLQEMSTAFGYDFRNVRIHTHHQAERLSKDIQAQAFTNGQDIYFNEGKYNPETAKGKKLLAHELTHVVQQQKKGT